MSTDLDKVKAIRKWVPPKNTKEWQAFLGLTGYYRQYLKDYATTAKPLTILTAKRSAWIWMETEQKAFEILREALIFAPILEYPDSKLSYILDTDTSEVGVGTVLSQLRNEKKTVIAYYSKTLSAAEQNYCVTRKELLAVVKTIKHFRP